MFTSTPSKTDTTDIRIVLIDDHEMFLHGLRMLIEKEPGLAIAGQATTRAEAMDVVQVKPDVILLDLALGNENSIEFIPALLEAAGDARCLILTGMADPDLHLQAVRLGIKGILLKSEAPASLFKAIRKVHAGEVWLSRSLVSSAMSAAFGPGAAKTDRETAKIAELTAREREVISLIAEGRKNKQIAERLFISEKTVGHYLSSIFSKLEVGDRLELLIYACQHGLARIPAQPLTGPNHSKAS
jgi:DNA-binding NarL/FixJ family response regulator